MRVAKASHCEEKCRYGDDDRRQLVMCVPADSTRRPLSKYTRNETIKNESFSRPLTEQCEALSRHYV